MALVVSHIANDFDALARQALRQQGLADLIELRVDRIGNPGVEALRSVAQASKKPLIVACPGPEDDGAFQGSIDERLDVLRTAAEAGCAFVDVHWELSLELGELPNKCHRIVSRHDWDGVPADLDAFHEDVRDVLYEGDVTKLVATAASCEEGLRYLRWLRTTKGVVGFCMGEAGAFTRVLAPVFGSPFTYGAPAVMPGEAAPEATAPGQLPADEMHAVMPPGGANQETAILGVVGNPARHSWSPRVHGMALKQAQLNALYVAFEPANLAGFLELADDENFRGLSVTAPFKREAFELCGVKDAGAEAAGAVNTLVREAAGWRGANTDVPAIRDTMDRAFALRGETAAGKRVLVLGAGGAARAAAWALKSVDAQVTLAARDRGKAEALAAELGCAASGWDEVEGLAYDALVHCTPVGSAGSGTEEESPLPEAWLREGCVVLDAVYRPIRTPLLRTAVAKGCTPVPGGEWFVRQAIAQYRLFTNSEPDEEIMRAAFEHALGAEG